MLTELTISTLRNINTISMQPVPGINMIAGDNGAGKTSLLEAIHLLALGRSFRTRSLKHIIQFDKQKSLIIATTRMGTPIGVQIDINTGLTVRANNAPLNKLSELASQLPLQFIPADCHHFFEKGPRYRRQLVDWGLFHVEPQFNYHWQSYRRILRQRNAAIRQQKSIAEIQLWDDQLVLHAEKITSHRQKQLTALLAQFATIFPSLCPQYQSATFSLHYQHGWGKNKNLIESLRSTLNMDLKLGYTRLGSHAADWHFSMNKINPARIFSHGQQKLFYLALCMAQAKIKQNATNDSSLLLFDDISSEMDSKHQQRVLTALASLPAQIFITSTNTALADNVMQVFHVKQGMLVQPLA